VWVTGCLRPAAGCWRALRALRLAAGSPGPGALLLAACFLLERGQAAAGSWQLVAWGLGLAARFMLAGWPGFNARAWILVLGSCLWGWRLVAWWLYPDVGVWFCSCGCVVRSMRLRTEGEGWGFVPYFDVEPFLFNAADTAIAYARKAALDNAREPADIQEQPIEGWLFYATYSPEGDAVWVVEKELDGEGS